MARNVVDVRTALTRFVRYFNLAGYPVLSIPCGLSDRGLPVGIQMIGPPFSERMLLRAGHAFEKLCPPVTPLTNCTLKKSKK
jgi:aspartyl-tRNA(Asn)/glutamyl-tRNA(Gln) amidotransferase subunit A